VIVVLIVVVVLLVLALAALATQQLRARHPADQRGSGAGRILFPFMANALSSRALEAALRLASVEHSTLVPVFLARVSLDLPLEAPLPRACSVALPLEEAIEQRAAEAGVPVDARIERGRSYRHALRQAIVNERFDRIVIAAAAHGNPGFDAEDVAWLLDHAPGEIVVLRPSRDEQLEVPVSSNGHKRTLRHLSPRH
jgi:hypothetical protein